MLLYCTCIHIRNTRKSVLYFINCSHKRMSCRLQYIQRLLNWQQPHQCGDTPFHECASFCLCLEMTLFWLFIKTRTSRGFIITKDKWHTQKSFVANSCNFFKYVNKKETCLTSPMTFWKYLQLFHYL